MVVIVAVARTKWKSAGGDRGLSEKVSGTTGV